MNLKKTLLFIIFTGIGDFQIAAQDENTVKKEILTVCVNGQIDALYYRSGNGIYRLHAHKTGIGTPIAYKGSNPLYLYAKAADLEPPKKGEPIIPPVAKITFPKDKRVLIVFRKDYKDKDRIHAVTYGASPSQLQAGDYRIYNFSREGIYASLDGQVISLHPKAHTALSSEKWRSQVADIEVKFGIKSKNTVKEIYSSVWGHRPQKRHFLFVFDRPNSPNSPLDIRRYYDVPSIPVSPAAAERVATISAGSSR